MHVSVFKDLFQSKEVPFIVPLQKVVERIRVGKSKEIVEKIRKSQSKELRNELKKTLPSILFAGEFSQRNSNALVKHSGLMVVDFDQYENSDVMQAHLEQLRQNPHFVLLFISPSGNGIKGVVRVPECDKLTHPKYFKAFADKFNYDYFDRSNSNVDRVCFESYDPNIYVNYDAEIFDAEIIDNGYSRLDAVPVLPLTDEDAIIDRIMKWNWKRDFREGERNQFIFDIAGAFCEYGVSQSTAIGYILNNVVYGDFPTKEAETAIRSAYRSRNFNSKFFENYAKISRIKHDLHKGKKNVISEHGISEETYKVIAERNEEDDVFWDINDKGKIHVSSIKYKTFLESQGFKKYFPEGSLKPVLVRIISNKVTIISAEMVKDFVLQFLLDRGEYKVYDFCAKYENLFTEKYLIMLETIELMLLQDTATTSYIAYRNGILEVTAESAALRDYIDIKGYVWESSIINRDFTPCDNDNNDYKTFIHNISNGQEVAMECMLGYLISTYKNRSNNKAVILNDEVISENPEGGTGKGLLVQGIEKMRRTAILDGKMFDDKKSFPFQTVPPDTQVLVFDDVQRNFNFENKFSLVTEGITIEKKNKDAVKLSVKESPKIVISTNYAIKGEGNSHDRRRHEIEVAQYYNGRRTPDQEFGRQLFDDWKEDDYQRFDNYMINCLQGFLKVGLIKQNAKNIRMRKFIAETCMEFFEFVSDRDNMEFNVRLDKGVKFEAFTSEYVDYKNKLTRKRFTIWVQKYCKFIDAEYLDGNSNGFHWFQIKTADVEVEDEILF